jgi:PEGA domain-containing protein
VLNLVAGPLEAAVRIDPTPASANVAIDGITVGRGVWEGKLRAGTHRIEVSAEGFLVNASTLVLERLQRRVVPIVLERDPSSPLWASAPRAHFAIEVVGGPLTGLAIAGDVGSCAKPCGAPLPVGMMVALRPGYQFPSGIAFHVDAGFFYLSQSVFARATNALPVGKPMNAGSADDSIQTYAATVGLAAAYRIGTRPIFTFRLGAGALLGATGDHRTGPFTNTLGQTYEVDVRDTRPTTYLYLAPEVRAGVKFAKRFEISAGVQGMFLAGLAPVSWGGGSK